MSDIVIKIENLSKQYRLGTINHGMLYKDIQSWWARKRGKEDPHSKLDMYNKEQIDGGDRFWALRDINFEVEQGDRVGIIGRNGAGKSTLLKILSLVTAPTSGSAKVKGRIASLLEVGTGFHPELTGRENVYINGAILGMKKGEIDRKFNEIVGFAGIEKFIDTPVKRYSSGMYVRLAFAVAAHLEPEILIVDEVLAVGDAQFQKKCLEKMGEFANEGRTVLFVSHNMAAIEALCNKAMILSEGRNSETKSTHEVVKKYLETISNDASLPLNDRLDRKGKGNIKFKEITMMGNAKNKTNVYAISDDIFVYLKIENFYTYDVTVKMALSISTAHESLISCDANLKGYTHKIPGSSESILVCKIYSPPLNIGNYFVNIAIFNGEESEDWITNATKFSIETGTFDGRVTTNFFPVLSRFEWAVLS